MAYQMACPAQAPEAFCGNILVGVFRYFPIPICLEPLLVGDADNSASRSPIPTLPDSAISGSLIRLLRCDFLVAAPHLQPL